MYALLPFLAIYKNRSLRAVEAINSAAILDVPGSNVILLDLEDGQMTSYPEQQVRENLVQEMRAWKPAAVFTWYPQMRFDLPPSQWDDLGAFILLENYSKHNNKKDPSLFC